MMIWRTCDVFATRAQKAGEEAKKQHDGEWAQDTRPAAAQCVPPTTRLPPTHPLHIDHYPINKCKRLQS